MGKDAEAQDTIARTMAVITTRTVPINEQKQKAPPEQGFSI